MIFNFRYKRMFWVSALLFVLVVILTLNFVPGETTNQRVERELRADPDGSTARRVMTVLDRPDYVSDIFKRLRPKVPAWLPRWLNGKLIVIEVSDA